ncbi:RHS repeat domain-containing protein [Undibacterium sp. WLHG33]|uniref:RHS repeat domain-containing protein n=1 Tax=Undibacterium sp. WLHG33 TaxID=3412482 RepID=UPI003C306ECA
MIDVFLVAARHIVLLAVIHQRSKHIKTSQPNGNPTVTTTYYAGAQEAEINNGQTTLKTYWPYGLGVEIDQPGSSTSELNWSHHDRLGSIISITDASGNLKEKLAYDSWGKRRTTDGSATPDNLDGQVDNKGYTGHEMLDQLDLVHMNGRIYDPLMARFLSADPMIQDPAHSQSYNRYTYVWNNPTNLTDPTGFTACNNDDKNCSSTAVVTPVKTCPKGATCINDTNGNAYQFLGYVRGNNSNSKDNSNGGGQENKSAANATNTGGRDPQGLSSALLDTVKGGTNGLMNLVELVPNLVAAGTMPGDPGYVRFLNGIRPSAYDTPLFGETIEFLTGIGVTKIFSELSSAGRSTQGETVQLGGAHGEVKGIPGNESHHMPADSVSPLSKNKGPAISMEKADHRETASWGSSREARAYRAEQADRIKNGDFRGAQQMDIHDIQTKFGAKYNEAMQQMKEYTKGLGY